MSTTGNAIVHVRASKVFANSRDVAAFFAKRHDNVLRDIDNLIAHAPKLRLLNFEETASERPNPSGGAPILSRTFEMDRDGFMLLAMGFTGAKALQWKLRYIEAFNAMEAQLLQPQQRIGRTPSREDLGYLRLIEKNYGAPGLAIALRELGFADMSGIAPRQQAKPAIEETASSDDMACLQLLLEFKTGGQSLGSIMARAHGEGPDSKRLRNYGIRLFEHEGAQGFAFWAFATRITRVFAGSRWPGREWEHAILRLPGAAALDLLKASNSNVATRPEVFISRSLVEKLGYR